MFKRDTFDFEGFCTALQSQLFLTDGFAFKIAEDEKLAVVQNIGSMDVSALRITDQGDPAIDETKTALINALAEQMQVYRLEI